MNVGNQIKLIAEKRAISMEEIANYLGITKDAVYKIYKQQHINTERLEQFSKFFNVPISFFLSEESSEGQSINGNGNLMAGRDLKNTADSKKNIAPETVYERLLEEKERTIRTQQELIEELRRNREKE